MLLGSFAAGLLLHALFDRHIDVDARDLSDRCRACARRFHFIDRIVFHLAAGNGDAHIFEEADLDTFILEARRLAVADVPGRCRNIGSIEKSGIWSFGVATTRPPISFPSGLSWHPQA